MSSTETNTPLDPFAQRLGDAPPLLEAATLDQPIPDVTQEDVARIIRRDFPANEIATVESLVEAHGTSLSPRIILAVLKLSEGQTRRVSENFASAAIDWRDVIAYAEYPSYMAAYGRNLDEHRRAEIIQEDWAQYSAWKNRR